MLFENLVVTLILEVRNLCYASQVFFLNVVLRVIVPILLLLRPIEILRLFLKGCLLLRRPLYLSVMNSEFYPVLYILVIVGCKLPKLVIVSARKSFISDKIC